MTRDERETKIEVTFWIINNCWRFDNGVDLANAVISKFKLEKFNWIYNTAQSVFDHEYDESIIVKYDTLNNTTIN